MHRLGVSTTRGTCLIVGDETIKRPWYSTDDSKRQEEAQMKMNMLLKHPQYLKMPEIAKEQIMQQFLMESRQPIVW